MPTRPGGLNIYVRRDNRNPGWFSDMSSAVKENVTVPVILTGGIIRPDQAKALLDAGKADLIGVGRAMYQNPGWGTYR